MRSVSADPNRPNCPGCGRPMARHKLTRRGQRYECQRCGVSGIPDELEASLVRRCTLEDNTALPLPRHLAAPQIEAPSLGCAHCIYIGQCRANEQAGLSVLCERTALILAGGILVMV